MKTEKSEKTEKTQAFFQVITVFPEMIQGIFSQGIVFQALKKGLLQLESITPRSFTEDIHKTVDDRPFGGGDGMILLTEPLEKALNAAKEKRPKARVIYLSPQGSTLTDAKVLALAQNPDLILLCGRYGGVDQRILNRFVDEEISVGDYVLSGGELAAAVVIDSVARQLPGVLGHADSALKESFRGGALEAPLFTRPQEFEGEKVPEVLLSGHHAKIEAWRRQVGLLVTLQKRPDLFGRLGLSEKEIQGLKEFWKNLSSDDRQALGFKNFEAKFEP